MLDKTRDGFIGKGASALVYRGRDTETAIGQGHMVAIKVGAVHIPFEPRRYGGRGCCWVLCPTPYQPGPLIDDVTFLLSDR